MVVFERVKKVADDRGLSLQEVATKAGLGLNSIYGWKKKDPSISRITEVAKVLDVSVDYLLGKKESPIKPQIDFADDDSFIAFYEGKPVSDDDMEIIKRLLRGK